MNAADEIIGRGRLLAGDAAAAVIEPGRSLDYAQLDRLINRYGNALLAAGVRRENRVLLMLDDGADFIAAYLAAIRIGAVAVAFNLRASAADLEHVIEETLAAVLIVEPELHELYRGIEARISHRPRVVVNGRGGGGGECLDDFLCGQSDVLSSVPMSRDDMAFWVYSSGTTGTPKAVVHLHHDVLVAERHLVENLGVKPRDRLFCTSRLFFAYALGNVLFGGLRAGATLILDRGWPDPERATGVVERHRPDYFLTVPTFYRNLLSEGMAERASYRRLRGCVSAGEALPPCVFEAWREAVGQPIFEGIGTSETLFLFIANHPRAWRQGSVGRLQPWVEAELRDTEGNEVIESPNTPGALWIRTESVADRYWNRQQLSRRTFVGDWYATGDMMSFDGQGWWRHHGRRDAMLKISGQWVSPVEIEDCACAFGDVAEAAVVGRTDEHGLTRSTMFVVPKQRQPDENSFTTRLLDHLRANLAVYKCPRDVRLVEELPRTDTGKLQRFVLRELVDS